MGEAEMRAERASAVSFYHSKTTQAWRRPRHESSSPRINERVSETCTHLDYCFPRLFSGIPVMLLENRW